MDESAPRGRARFQSLLRLVIPLVLLAAGAWLVIRPAEPKNPPANPPDLNGIWVGGYELKDGWTYLRTHFRVGSSSTIDQPFAQTEGDVLWQVRSEASRVHFELIKSADHLVFDGEFRDGAIVGEVRQAQLHGSFQLVQVRGPIESIEDIPGMYDVGAGRLIGISRAGWTDLSQPGGLGRELVYQDFSSGRTGVLFAVGKDTFALGPGMLVPLPMEAQVRIVRDAAGTVAGLQVREGSRAEAPAKRLTLREEAVRFENGNVNLYGTLTLPGTPGAHPGVVFVPPYGSRAQVNDYARLFARHGIAVLAYDARGITTGSFEVPRPEALAQDVLAGVHLLKSRRDINPTEVGLWGIYAGGALAVAAAAQSPEVAFVALLASPVVPLWEGVRDRIEHELLADGFAAGDIAEALNLTRLWEESQRARQGNQRLNEATTLASRQKWWPYFSSAPWNPSGAVDYDPAPALEKLRAPVLAVFGELDQLVPARKNRERLEAALQRASNTDYKVVIVPNANHDFLVAQTGGRKEWPRLSRMAPGYLETTIDWILAHTDTGPLNR